MCNEEFDIEDYEDDFRGYYCNPIKCLKNSYTIQDALENYVRELYKELYIFQEPNKTVEDIYDDLECILRIHRQ